MASKVKFQLLTSILFLKNPKIPTWTAHNSMFAKFNVTRCGVVVVFNKVIKT